MYKFLFKRLFDIFFTIIALIVLSPIMLLTCLAIKLEDGGSILYVQKRVGKKNKNFKMYKFRSMPENTKSIPSHLAGDIKITKTGKFIRRSNIDELPQLLNILKGDMSIVGPRPAIPSQKELIQLRKMNKAIECVPGLTGLAQINAFDNMPTKTKADYDGLYAKNISLIQDVKIILNTFTYLFKPPPTY